MKKPVIFMDLDGVIFDFVEGFKEQFGVDPTKLDKFTTFRYYSKDPHFFRKLPLLQQGYDLFLSLKDKYKIVFLTTPDERMPFCKIDKIDSVRENLGEYDIFFSDDKSEYVTDDKSILIDDDYSGDNGKNWKFAGGTFIKFPQRNDKIISIIEKTFNPKEEIIKIKKQVKDMDVNTNPSLAQKESGLYKKAKIGFKGLNLVIENPKGSIRWGIGENGVKWRVRMKHHYGYISGSEGNDCDQVDCFLGDKYNASRAFVVNQTKGNMFDEHKVMLGFDNAEEALEAYLSNYQKGWKNYTNIVQTNTKKLREWLSDGNIKEPFPSDL